METEHELREEVDMSQNQIRQLERRLDASQDTIIDQQQTIEKFREVVRHLQVCCQCSLNDVTFCTKF